ncbi:MAG TPA: metallophosphoesterase family protein [Candidatus Nanoarchaeia archaeon]|nr:metallophosphoesterase family protein [Candidatus Nanoarchaeia archaeon]
MRQKRKRREADQSALPLYGIQLVISDIQGNYSAFHRFAQATKRMRADNIFCLGDIVQNGQNYDDNRCLDLVRQLNAIAVAGNHEQRLSRTVAKVTRENLQYAATLPECEIHGPAIFFHSSLRSPGLRLHTPAQFRAEATYLNETFPGIRIAFFGHTHDAAVHSVEHGRVQSYGDRRVELDPRAMSFVNPGGLGLGFGEPQTFVRADFDNGIIDYFSLTAAERLAYRAEVVAAFDGDWMPALISAGRAPAVFQQAICGLQDHHDSALGPVVAALAGLNSQRDRHDVEQYSARLADAVAVVYRPIANLFDIPDPIRSRTDLLKTAVRRFP